MKNIFLLVFLFLSIASYGQSVEDSIKLNKVVVITFDGLERVGYILKDDGREIKLETSSIGVIYISKNNIKKIIPFEEVVSEEYDGDYRSSGPFTTRYYFTTNALPIKKNEDYALLNLYGPEVHFSLSNNFSLGIMTTWIASPFVLAMKYTIPTKNDNLNFGVGSLIGTSGYLNNFRGYGGLHWGMMTIGDRMKNLTISAGYSYVNPSNRQRREVEGIYYKYTDDDGNIYNSPYSYTDSYGNFISAPVVSIAGITRIGKKASFFFDSMIFFGKTRSIETSYTEIEDPYPGYTLIENSTTINSTTLMILMPGMRFQRNDSNAFQFALAGVTRFNKGKALSFPFPSCSWFFKF